MERLNEIQTRKAEIKALLESDQSADLDAITKELDALDEEERSINAEIEERQLKESAEIEERKKIAETIKEGEVIATPIEERKIETMEITRNSPEYVNAFAEYIKSGKDDEVRSLLTENVGGTIAVPELVYDTVKTAWDREELMRLVNRTNLKGNLKVQFEISGSDAVVHLEGSEAITEETLTEGIVEIVPASIKKFIGISDEVYDLRGEAFLRYIYDELTYRIAKKCADELVAKIIALPDTATSSSPSANAITSAPAMSLVAEAIGNLSDEATNPVVVMNKLTWSTFKALQYANGYAVDPFEGLRVHFNNSLPAYTSATDNAVYMFVGDLGQGAIANFPNGEDIEFKFDALTKKKEDIIEIMGRRYVGLGVVADKAFTLVKKPAASI